jgi:hypothetical protein
MEVFHEIRVLVAFLLLLDVKERLLVVIKMISAKLGGWRNWQLWHLETMRGQLVIDRLVIDILEGAAILLFLDSSQFYVLALVLIVIELQSHKRLLVDEQSIGGLGHGVGLQILGLLLLLEQLGLEVDPCGGHEAALVVLGDLVLPFLFFSLA